MTVDSPALGCHTVLVMPISFSSSRGLVLVEALAIYHLLRGLDLNLKSGMPSAYAKKTHMEKPVTFCVPSITTKFVVAMVIANLLIP
jgi:hypothetical protein